MRPCQWNQSRTLITSIRSPEVPCHPIASLLVCSEAALSRKLLVMDFTPNEPVTFPLVLASPQYGPCSSPQVFNLNAPVPPASETEALNQANQYQNSYNQAFNSQSQHPVEQTEMQSEQLQSGGKIFTVYFPIIN